METVNLAAEKRTEVGSRAVRRLRRAGKIPGNLFGHGEPECVTLDAHAFETAWRHHARLITLKMADGDQAAVVHDLAYHPVSHAILHVDLYRVRLDEKLEVHVPLRIRGPAKGEQSGGILQEIHSEVLVACLPAAIPEFIEVDVRELDIHQGVHAGDLVLPEGVALADDAAKVLITVAEPRYVAEEAPAAEEAATEPEVIGKPEKEPGEGAPPG